MPHDLFDVEDLDPVEHRKLNRFVGHLEEVLHERERGVPKRSLAGYELAQLEQPQAEFELPVVTLQVLGVDEGRDEPMDGRLGDRRPPPQVGELDRQVVDFERAEDAVDLPDHRAGVVPFSGRTLRSWTSSVGVVNLASR